MNALGNIINAVENHKKYVNRQARKARTDSRFAAELIRQWRKINLRIPEIETPAGLRVPRLALPQTEEPGEIARFLFGEGMPGEFPFVTAAYPEMYLEVAKSEPARESKSHTEEPT